MKLAFVLLVVLFVCISRSQIVIPTIVAPTEQTGINQGPSDGGEEFNIHLRLQVEDADINCTATFSHPTRLVQTNLTLDPRCIVPPSNEFTQIICPIAEVNATTLNLVQGRALISQICPSTTYSITLACGSANAANPPSFDIDAGTSDISVELTHDAVNGDSGNLTNVPIVDYQTNPIYTLTARVTNIGCSPATGLICHASIPSPLTTPVADGVIEFLPDNSTGLEECRRLVNNFDCPGPLSPISGGYTLALNSTQDFVWVVSLTGNGTLSSSITCDAARSGGEVEDSIVAYGIGFFVNTSSSEVINQESDNTDDLVINTIVPLSVFGGIMLFLLIVGAVTIGVYIFVKKVILSEENVGF